MLQNENIEEEIEVYENTIAILISFLQNILFLD